MYAMDAFEWRAYHFQGKCPTCGKTVVYAHHDMRDPIEKARPVVTRWPPQFMRINYHPITRTKEFFLETTRYTQLVEGINKGDLIYLAETEWELMQAVIKKQLFKFEEGYMYHMEHSTVSCCLPALQGWGVPPFMSEFETALLVMLLDKFNEAILVDYLVPFRVLTPPSGKGTPESDPLLQINAGTFTQTVRGMIRQHRRNPTGWHFLPYPLQYQALGAEAKNITPVEIMEHFEARLLSSLGIPQEFSTSSLNVAAPVIGFRMFERSWQYFADELNLWLTWLVQRTGELMSWEKVSARLIPVSIYEDPELRALKLQLSAAGQVSKTTAFKAINLDPEYERKRIMEEEDEFAEMMRDRQLEQQGKETNIAASRTPSAGEQVMSQEMMAQQAAGGAPGAEGAPAGPAAVPGAGPGMMTGAAPSMPAPSATIDDLLMQADIIAQQLLVSDPLARRRTLTDLKHQDEALYAQVKARLGQLEDMSRQQGVQLTRAGQLPPPTA